MSYKPDEYPAQSGNLIDEDGSVKNIVTILGGESLSDKVYPQKPAKSGRVIGEDGKLYSLIELLQGVVAGEGSIADGSVTLDKLAQEVLVRIDRNKFTPLSGNSNDANALTSEGVYFNNGGYGLGNAPRNNYGWMLIVSHGSSNGHPRGGQLYLDKDGFDFRGFDGDTFGEWETFIIKNKVDHLEPIADPTTATVEDLANAYNALLAALKE